MVLGQLYLSVQFSFPIESFLLKQYAEMSLFSRQTRSDPKTLTGLTLLFGEGFAEDEVTKLETLAISHGAKVSTTISKRISCLLVKVVGGVHCHWCLDQKVPVVRAKWLVDCALQKRCIPFQEYLAQPFTGLVISCTGLSTSARTQIRSVIEKHGGVFSRDLVKNLTTHLICAAADGEKYNVAKEWGCIHVVSEEWVEECIQFKRRSLSFYLIMSPLFSLSPFSHLLSLQ